MWWKIKQTKKLDKPIFEDWSETREEVFDGWSHLGHSNDVDNGLESGEDTAEDFGVLLSQVLVENHTKMT